MPYLISTSFDRFLVNITIDGDLSSVAAGRGAKIAELLRDAFRGPQIIPTGSLLRGTGLKGSSDLDVIAVLHYGTYVKGKTPTALLEDVRAVLSDYNAQIVKKNGQAVTLYFKTWPNVDIVPAVRIRGYNDLFHIPDANTGSWIPTSPAAHDAAMAAIPLRRRQLGCMIKRWNVSHSGYFESFHIEQVALQVSAAHDGYPWGEDGWPWAINQFFEKAMALTGPREPMSIPSRRRSGLNCAAASLGPRNRRSTHGTRSTPRTTSARRWIDIVSCLATLFPLTDRSQGGSVRFPV